MRKIIEYIRSFVAEDFRLWYYLTVLGFTGLCFYLNYFTAPDGLRSWEMWLIRNWYSSYSAWCVPAYFVFYAFPYFSIALITAAFYKESRFLGNKDFWLRSLFILLVISVHGGLGVHRYIAGTFTFPPDKYYLTKTLATIMPVVFIGIPVLLFWWRKDRKRGVPFMYGLTKMGFDAAPYLVIMGVMLPLVIWAAMQQQFLDFYPTIQVKQLSSVTFMPTGWLAFVLYELCYGLYFVWAEVVFRGFLTVGMKDSMGRHAVAPMTGLYAFRHFAKPPGETISSVFGGYLLGILAFRTNNIVGGAILHGTIAVLMDVLAWLQQ